jgi:hypothetical protein
MSHNEFAKSYLIAQGVYIYPPPRTQSASIDRRMPETPPVKVPMYERGNLP